MSLEINKTVLEAVGEVCSGLRTPVRRRRDRWLCESERSPQRLPGLLPASLNRSHQFLPSSSYIILHQRQISRWISLYLLHRASY